MRGRAIASRVTIESQISPDPLFVNGDIEQFHLVFVNLLINAVESMASGGVIEVKAIAKTPTRRFESQFATMAPVLTTEMQKRLFVPSQQLKSMELDWVSLSVTALS